MVKEYRAMGKEDLGYNGERLAAFIEERLKEWKAEKAAKRQKELELARISADREAQAEMARLAHAAKERELAHALELEKLMVEARTADRDNSSTNSGVRVRPIVDHRMVQLSMPRFNDKEESIDDFLEQFEKLACVHKVPEHHWAINVSAFL